MNPKGARHNFEQLAKAIAGAPLSDEETDRLISIAINTTADVLVGVWEELIEANDTDNRPIVVKVYVDGEEIASRVKSS